MNNPQRFHFAEAPDEIRPAGKIWFTRMIITAMIVGCFGAAHIILGFRIF